MPTRIQGATWVSSSLHHQLLCRSLIKTMSQVIITPSPRHSSTFWDSYLQWTFFRCRRHEICRAICRTMSRKPYPSHCLSRDLKPTYLNNLWKYRLWLNFVTVPLTLDTIMLRHFKHGLDNNNNNINNNCTIYYTFNNPRWPSAAILKISISPNFTGWHTPDLKPAYSSYVKCIENNYASQNCKVSVLATQLNSTSSLISRYCAFLTDLQKSL